MEAKHLSNRDLLNGLASASPDDPMWAEFVSRFRGRLRQVVYRSYQTELTRNPGLDSGAAGDAVDDLTQEVFLKLVDGDRRALSRFHGRSEYSAHKYLSAIAVNLVRDHFKKLRALKSPKAPRSLSAAATAEEHADSRTLAHHLVSGGPGPETFVASSELRERIREVIASVSPRGSTSARDRLVFELYFIEGLTVDEIAQNAGIRLSASGVEKCIRRIRDALKSQLDAG